MNRKQQLLQYAKSVVKQKFPKAVVAYITKKRYVKEVRGHYIPEFDLLRCLIQKGDTVVDIGANFGWYTKFLSERVEQEGKVYSIEPIPLNFRVLTYVVSRLRLDNVEPYQYAISDCEGTVTMAVPLSETGDEKLYEAMIVKESIQRNAHTVTVKTKTLDSLFANSTAKLSFIKCDVEGHELQCLKGGAAVLQRFHPAWQIEVWGDPDIQHSAAYETFNVLTANGYHPYIYNGKTLKRREKGEQQTDFFFLTPSHIHQVKKAGSIAVVE